MQVPWIFLARGDFRGFRCGVVGGRFPARWHRREKIMEYIYWTIGVLVAVFVVVRLVFWKLFKQERYKG